MQGVRGVPRKISRHGIFCRAEQNFFITVCSTLNSFKDKCDYSFVWESFIFY